MPYYISYKGKKLGSPLSRHEAEEKLIVLSRCFQQLEIIREQAPLPAVRMEEEADLARNNK